LRLRSTHTFHRPTSQSPHLISPSHIAFSSTLIHRDPDADESKADEELIERVCIQGLKLCCGEGRYGKTCEACPGSAASPCNGHGVCDGEGTRGGKGKCKCDLGYKGKSCTSCKKGFYKAQPAPDSGAPECKQCDVACAACTGASPTKCSEVGVTGDEPCRPHSHNDFFFLLHFLFTRCTTV
jgi:hypothetical protein